MAEHMSIDKQYPPIKEDTEESVGSSPEAEQSLPAGVGNESTTHEAPTTKRKGGRKPIYATTEERKQRNRQAQAAFRERRTEYIKQLEQSIRAHEATLHSLQMASRGASEECLMLRYKNSLLERILLEKGIDVQAELRAKTDSPNLGPARVDPKMITLPPIPQRSIISRHKSRRSMSSIGSKIDPGSVPMPPSLQTILSSPKTRPPPPPSYGTSPDGSGPPLALSSTASDVSYRSASSISSRAKPLSGLGRRSIETVMRPGVEEMGSGHEMAFYQEPGYQNRLQQLECEYNGPAEVMDESDMDPPPDTGAYAAQFGHDGSQGMDLSAVSPSTQAPPNHAGAHPTSQGYPSMADSIDNNFDPFGLTASMTFPVSFSFDQGSHGHT